MKKHIELAKKSLADNDSVTLEELKANLNDAYDAWSSEDYKWYAEYASFRAARAAYLAARDVNAEYYKQKAREAIAEYEELTR